MAIGLLRKEIASQVYRTSARKLIACYEGAKRGRHIKSGIWSDPVWTPEAFIRWFRRCLDDKISGRIDPDCRHARNPLWRKMDPEYQLNLRLDARVINDYMRRIRHSGSRQLLRLPEMKAKYPHIDCQEFVD